MNWEISSCDCLEMGGDGLLLWLWLVLVLTLTLWHAETPRAPSRQFLWRAAGWRVTPAHVSHFYTPVTNTRCRHSVDRVLRVSLIFKNISRLCLHSECHLIRHQTIFSNLNVDQGKSRTFTLWEAHSLVHSQQYEAKIKHCVITNILYTLRGRDTSHTPHQLCFEASCQFCQPSNTSCVMGAEKQD